MEIEYETLEVELRYPDFNRSYNLVEPFDVSDRERWTILMGLDPHPRTAQATVWSHSTNTMTVLCAVSSGRNLGHSMAQ